MKTLRRFAVAAAVLGSCVRALAAEPPAEWVDPATGHRIVRLSVEPRSSSFYFHQNGYSPNGDSLVFTSPSGLSAVDLKTRKITQIVSGRADQAVVGRKTRQVFFVRHGTVYATDLETLATRQIAKFPAGFQAGSGLAVNADDTLLAGSVLEVDTNAPRASVPGNFEERWAAHLPMRLYFIEIANGQFKTFYSDTNWLNHVQFSPTDPGLVMFCHEGPWHKVDRIWTIRTDGSSLRKIHARTMDMEIAGHEFFSADGKTIWFDLQTPKGREFWLAGVRLDTGETTRYSLPREEWSVHYNISRDGTMFCGDGGGPRSVAAPGNGKWIYLFTPEHGSLKAEKLVDLSGHDYSQEPNATFTPDGQWIVFHANMQGASHVYAVEVAKAEPKAAGQ